VDELRTALELATEEELLDLTEILFCRKFNPLDYLQVPDPVRVQNQHRDAWLDALEDRFRFLAADGITVLKGKTSQVSYRHVLLQVCRHLKLPYSPSLSTTDLEAEIFLNLLNRAWRKLPVRDQKTLKRRINHSIAEATTAEPLLRKLPQDPLRLILEGGSALAVNAVIRPILLQQVAYQFALHFATYQAAEQAAVRGGAALLQLQAQAALQTAQRGMAFSAARYGAIKGVFTFLGPALWVWFFGDLGWRAIATNYGRVIPTVFALAQIRLTRVEFSPA